MDIIISPLSKFHNRKSLDCGEQSLNDYLLQYANQDIKRRINKIFIISPVDRPQQVIGYYGLCAGSLDATTLPKDIHRSLPKYLIPVVLLGRLAIINNRQRQGLGSILLIDALKRVVQASNMIAVYAVIVDALNDQAAGFYQQFGFISLPNQPLKLFLPMDSVVTLLH